MLFQIGIYIQIVQHSKICAMGERCPLRCPLSFSSHMFHLHTVPLSTTGSTHFLLGSFHSAPFGTHRSLGTDCTTGNTHLSMGTTLHRWWCLRRSSVCGDAPCPWRKGTPGTWWRVPGSRSSRDVGTHGSHLTANTLTADPSYWHLQAEETLKQGEFLHSAMSSTLCTMHH